MSANVAWRGRKYSTPEKKAFEQQVAMLLPRREMITGKVEVHYKFYLKNHSRTDGGNLEKVLTDCLVRAGYIQDDRFIYRYIIDKIPSGEDKIAVQIKPKAK